MSESKGCNTSCGCSTEKASTEQEKRTLQIEFLYLDREVCTPCRATENNLEEALAEVAGILRATGVEVNVNKIQVESIEQAVELGFLSSPTIRVNGKDLQFDVKENHCATCSALAGTSTDCRVWVYQGQEYSAAPKAMVVEAILREVYGGSPAEPRKIARNEKVLENLTRFFDAKRQKEFAGAA
jgi:hypothetical protein